MLTIISFSVQLLHKLSIRSANGPQKLLKVIKNPISSHLPVGCKKIGTSFKAQKLVHPRELVPSDDAPLAIVIGAMAHGMVGTLKAHMNTQLMITWFSG